MNVGFRRFGNLSLKVRAGCLLRSGLSCDKIRLKVWILE
jgi:hypothetical protein